MNSTWSNAGLRAWLTRLVRSGSLLLLLTLATGRLVASEDPMPRPPELERDVQFWIRVYSQVDTNGGFLHDQYNLGVIYDTLRFAPNTSPHEREALIEQERTHYVAALRRIAAPNGGPLSEEDQHILDMWGAEGTPARLLEATDDIRFQLGQADRFRAGLIRSGAWETHIAETLANLGLPAELAVLPHVESSFNPAAYSKVGAAGLWQFMRSTGRRYMRIDNAVDDRLDPFRSTEAAAQLLAYNYRLLGTWPLALTAYNHGAEGVRRAKESLGTDDIVQIVRNYKGRTFGFASRNFYVSFLAALEIDRNPEKYFGPMERTHEARFQEVVVPAYVQVKALERALKINQQTLRDLNPALLRTVWEGQRHVPKAYRLRLPLEDSEVTSDLLAQRLAPSELFAGQPEPRRYKVRKGDTLASVADRYGLTPEALARLNRLRTSVKLRPGKVLSLPESTAGLVLVGLNTHQAGVGVAPGAAGHGSAGATSAPGNAGTAGIVASSGGAASAGTGAGSAGGTESAVRTGAGVTAPSATHTGGASSTPGSATPVSTGIYIVQSGDALSDIAAKFGMTESQLMKLNDIRGRDFIFEGQQLQVAAAASPGHVAASNSGTPLSAGVINSRAVASSTTPVASAAVPSTSVPSTERVSGATPAPGSAAVAVVGTGAVAPAEAAHEDIEEAKQVAKIEVPAENAQPVSAAQAEELSPALGPAADTQQNADPTDYSVGKDNTIRVAAAETLGHYADWARLTAPRIRQLNHMKQGRPVLIGHKLKLDFSRVSRETFETKRREYHQELQASYFAAHRIIGTEVYIVRRGDSLWTVTQRFEQLPIWLLQQYNPDVDLADLHPGTQIVMPRIEDVVAGQS